MRQVVLRIFCLTAKREGAESGKRACGFRNTNPFWVESVIYDRLPKIDSLSSNFLYMDTNVASDQLGFYEIWNRFNKKL